MIRPVAMAELWRNDRRESYHLGHAVIADGSGAIVKGWGDPATEVFPRSSCKMIQALPLMESGAGAGLHRTDARHGRARGCQDRNRGDVRGHHPRTAAGHCVEGHRWRHPRGRGGNNRPSDPGRVLDADHPAARKRLNTVERNWRGIAVGSIRAAPGFP